MSKDMNPLIRIVGIFTVLMVFASAHAQNCGLGDNGDGTMTDQVTGLQIRKCAIGQSWVGGRCTGSAKEYKWDDAVRAFGGDEWRLISREEAEQVVKRSKSCAIAGGWTSSPYLNDASLAWYVNFSEGFVEHGFGRSYGLAVHLVRFDRNYSNTSASSSNILRPNPAQNTQQTTAQSQSTQPQNRQSPQAQQSAQQNQARADQQRQGQRKTHDPAAEAHECIAIDKAGSGNYGAFKNQCPYPVNFITCNEKPRTIQGGFNWSADSDCAKQQFGLHTPKGNSSVAAHNRNTEFVHWFACKAPAMPTDGTYVPGKGIEARCHN
jgi:hypothetical protein